jgi:hypothetical protein
MTLPPDFSVNSYKFLNPDLNQKASDQEIIHHYLNYGKDEGRRYFTESAKKTPNEIVKQIINKPIEDVYPEIIGYIHVCQIGKWRITFDMIMNSIKKSGLYNQMKEIRVGIVNNESHVIPDKRFTDPKIVIIGHGPSRLYERLTLHTMRKNAETENCQYWYAHTKGISHFENNSGKKDFVIDWIKLMIYWNFKNWRIASNNLLSHDTYGCEYTDNPTCHFSGNFWWANSQYVRTLPNIIGSNYCDPEFWILNRSGNIICNIFSSGLDGGDHYFYKSGFFN